MHITKIVGGRVFTPQGWLKDATIVVSDGKIAEISVGNIEIANPDQGSSVETVDARGMMVVPGGVELHIHGGGGRDFMEGTEDAFRTAINAHMQHGTTSIYPTLSSSSMPMIKEALATCEKMMAEPGSPVLGLHLEGPYFNPKKAGAQMPEYITPPKPEDYEPIIKRYGPGSSDLNTDSPAIGALRRWDEAPELPGTSEFGRFCTDHGVLAAIAHTNAEYPDVKRAWDAGFRHVTHFYNAMPGFHNVREFKHEGTVESVYTFPEMSVEMIADGIHVPPTILRMIYMVKGVEHTALITDALACSASDSDVAFDPRVILEDGVCKLADRSALAGSIATMDRLIRTCVQMAEIPLDDAIRMSSETPARIMGELGRKGSLQAGKDADICFYNDDLQLQFVMQQGNIVKNEL
ncbi:MAG: N-acetylglucosamine-6-phosphate deacetylase [Bacteroidaceae bacterium]|nr:N-acetylglucosamine-6-phosphate deacetylase [Bacteroidaceae bacterium]